MRNLFVSHGAPNLVIARTPAAQFLANGLHLPDAPVYVVVSAHWCTRGTVRVASARLPETIHDFGGFERELYTLQYPAPGAPGFAMTLVDALAAPLAAQGMTVAADENRGLDHGVWVPLMLARPRADIPVLAVSLPYPASAQLSLAFGAALRAAVDAVIGVDAVVIGSGSITHRLAAFGAHELYGPPAPEAAAFLEWMVQQLQTGNREALVDWRAQAPHGIWNHPTDEHLLPLFVALGAGGLPARCLHSSWEWGILAMDTWQFGG